MITIALLSTEEQSNILHIINPGPKGQKKKKKTVLFYSSGCIKAELDIQRTATANKKRI